MWVASLHAASLHSDQQLGDQVNELPKDFRIVADQFGDPWVTAEAVIPAASDDELMVVFEGTVMPKSRFGGGVFQSGEKTWGQYCREASEREQLPVPAVAQARRYFVGYYCPRGNGHWEMYGDEDYSTECRGKGWDIYLEGAEQVEDGLPAGEWE